MVRIKRGVTTHKKHKKVLKATKGYRGTRHRLIKVAREASLHAGAYAYHGRKLRKRDMRRLWITRINGELKRIGLSYNKFINDLKKAKIEIDRKILADLVVSDPNTFSKIVSLTKNL